MKTISFAAAALLVSVPVAFAQTATKGQQMTESQCLSVWNKANPSGAPTLSEAQAKGYVTNFKAANPDNDGSLDKSEFMAACSAGYVKSGSASGAGSGTSGTGSKSAPQ